jgi:hypothetical protein
MRCWNCGKTIPADAKACRFCEATIEPQPTAEEEDIVRNMLREMAPEAMPELQSAFEESTTAEEFANRIMVGDCPQCGSADTSDCENDPEIVDPTVGRCFECGQLWCIECGGLLQADDPFCEQCDLDDEWGE